MAATTEQMCEAIARHRLLPAAELDQLRGRWFKPGRDGAADPDKFARWVVANHYLSDFVVRMLRAGRAELLRFNQYQLTDHLTSGPLRGAYVGLDPLGRRVLLEFLAAAYAADGPTRRAYLDAAERALTVRHANVDQVLDFGQAHGRHFLVREHCTGETLADVLHRRGRLSPVSAGRLFALTLAGLQALHERQVPAGELTADCLIFTAAGSGKARTVKILQAGLPRSLFDPAALEGEPAADADAIPPILTPARPEDDLHRLGLVFYRCLTGQAPGTGPDGRPVPVGRINPEVPEMLAEIIDQMIDPDPAARPKSAAQTAKRLRIFLASDEGEKEVRAEENLAPATAPAVAATAEEEPAEEEVEEPAAKPTRPAAEGVPGKLQALWEEVRPGTRELFYLGAGAGGVILLILLLRLVTGISIVNVVCLLAGGAISFLLEQWLRVREQRQEE